VSIVCKSCRKQRSVTSVLKQKPVKRDDEFPQNLTQTTQTGNIALYE